MRSQSVSLEWRVQRREGELLDNYTADRRTRNVESGPEGVKAEEARVLVVLELLGQCLGGLVSLDQDLEAVLE